MVRIVGGKYRGKKLNVPVGTTVRPTTDRVRENLFNILDHRFDYPCGNADVLDLFSGAGSLGLEALSRGARHVTFVERDSKVIKTLRQNVGQFDALTDVIAQSVDAFLAGVAKEMGIVFMDPPYNDGLIDPTLETLVRRSWLKPEALVCLEYPKGASPKIPEELDSIVCRTYGGTVMNILKAN